MFVYENEYDSSLVVGAGLMQDWIDSPEGMSIENLPTYYGELSYSIKKNENSYKINLFGSTKIPSGGIVIKNFNGKQTPKKVLVNGKESADFTGSRINVKMFPVEIEVVY